MIYRYRMYFLNFFFIKKKDTLYILSRFIRKLLLLFNFVAESDYYVEKFKC